MIFCRECGGGFSFLPPHLRLGHGMDVAAYRTRWHIPASESLASIAYREAHRKKLKRLPPGAKRADGRDADWAREYQREFRARKR